MPGKTTLANQMPASDPASDIAGHWGDNAKVLGSHASQPVCFQRASYVWAIPCQRFEKKGQRRKVDFF